MKKIGSILLAILLLLLPNGGLAQPSSIDLTEITDIQPSIHKLTPKEVEELGLDMSEAESLKNVTTKLSAKQLQEIKENPKGFFSSDGTIISDEEIEKVLSNKAVDNPVKNDPKSIVPQVVIGEDTRSEITDTSVTPYRAVARLIIKRGNSEYLCTGAFVDRGTILTAAHCLFDNKSNVGAQSIQVRAGYTKHGGSEFQIGGIMWAYGYYVPNTWVDLPGYSIDAVPHDWAIIKVDPNDGNAVGSYFSISSSAGAGSIIGVPGYPSVEGSQKYNGNRMWLGVGTIEHATPPNMFLHNADTSGGQSGAPTFTGIRTLQGVHSGGSELAQINFAKKLDADTIGVISSLME